MLFLKEKNENIYVQNCFFFKGRLYLQFDLFFLFQLVIPCFNYLYVGFKMKCFFLMMTFKKKWMIIFSNLMNKI